MKVSRADWAANVHWDNVSGKPSFLNASSSATDEKLQALEDRINAIAAAVASSATAPASVVTLEKLNVEFSVTEILPLQFVSETFNVAGVSAGETVFATTVSNLQDCLVSCNAPLEGLVTIVIFNPSIVPAAINTGTWTINILRNA